MKKKIKTVISLALAATVAAGAALWTGSLQPAQAKQAAAEVNASLRAQDILDGMTMHEKACQMMVTYQYSMYDGSYKLSATETGNHLKNALERYPVGGILYDMSSMKSHDQLQSLVSTADSYSEIPLLFTIDEEGGRVSRIGQTLSYHVGDPDILSSLEVVIAGKQKCLKPMQTYESQGPQKAYDNAKFLAENIAWHGFNLDFAPVADTDSNPSNTVIGQRAYSKDFDSAAELVPAAVQGFHDGGVGCTLKHFPGHGDTSGDTHAGSVVLKKTVDELRANELKPFQAGINAGADAVMLAHIIVEEIGEPTLFSHYMVTDVLREEMGFNGVVITDGLGMKAMTDVYSVTDIVVKGTRAGVDMFCCPANLEEAVTALEKAVESGEITEERIDESVLRILQLKIDRGIIK